MRWEYWDRVKQQIAVSRAVWQAIVGTPKTSQSSRFLAVSPELREVLLALWKKRESPIHGYILAGAKGRPVNLDNLAKRTIRPRLNALNAKENSNLTSSVTAYRDYEIRGENAERSSRQRENNR